MKIKICGITKLEDAKLCVEYGVDAIGFIFYPKSKRHISSDDAKIIANSLPIFTHKIGVFVNEDANEVNSIAKYVGLSGVQLHGDETVEYISQISHPVIKSFGVNESFNFSLIDSYKDCTILLDVKDSEQYGGTGNSFNWELIPKRIRNEVIIAGGVSPNNINDIHEKINPYGIDLSSSVEVTPGIKDSNKIIEVLKIVNQIKQEEYDRKRE
ncbi:MAG: phosphoribosylanthranilate isomerase [Melioribacteraceae bacterium]|nr:phosphoribosylanthranilate isomerase [Melioribacteraceae bacterium]